MKNRRFTKHIIKAAAYLMALSIIGSQTIVSVATEKKAEAPQEDEALPEQSDAEQTETDEEERDTEEASDGESDGEQEDDEAEVRHITAITALSADQAYLTYEKKPSAEELEDRFPAVLTVTLDDSGESEEIEVTWTCDTDYEAEWSGEGKECYTFLPVWDEEVYVLSEEEAETVTIPTVTVEIIHEEVTGEIADLETAQEELEEIAEQKSILAVLYLCEQYEVKEEPDVEADTVDTAVCGQSVQIVGVELDEAGNVWYEVSFYDQDQEYTGYIEKRYLASSDENFLTWTEEYVQKAQAAPKKKLRTISLAAAISSYPDVNQFPASYQNQLLALKQKYPNWIFVKMETGVDFNTAVSKEMGDKSWIQSKNPASWQNGATPQKGWSYASEGILRYYMDPRNFLTETSIFQFEQLTYNSSYHTESAVKELLAGTFMAGDIPNEGTTYAAAFTRIGSKTGVSPFHLASRVIQEQGRQGSQMVFGTYRGYEGYYNFFNVGASGGNTDDVIRAGLKYAQEKGWNTRYASLEGGASVIGTQYILRGQDTLYLQKFNVTNNNRYGHQYMQNIAAPSSEAPGIQKAYTNTGSLDNSFVFKIPVYGNMPASVCSKPDTTDTITLNKTSVDSLAVDDTQRVIPYVNGFKVDSLSTLTFASDNTDVATVDAQGVIKAVSPGKATVTCSKSGARSASCSVTVVKAEPAVDTPVLSPVVYKAGLKLSDISLPEGWRWKNETVTLKAGTSSYPAVYTPQDTVKYLTVERQVGLKVSKAIPSCTVPASLSAKLGSRLGSIALPGGFAWESDAETVLDKAGEKTFYLTYDPQDDNYSTLEHIPVVVRVIDDSAGQEEEDEDYPGTLPDTGSGSGSGGTGSGSGSGSGGSGSGSGTGGSSSSGGGSTTSKDSTGGGNTTSKESTSSGSTTSQSSTGSGGTTSKGSTSSGTTSRGSTASGSPGMEGPGIEDEGSGTVTSSGSNSTTSRESTNSSSNSTTSKESTSNSSSTTTSKESTSSGSSTTSKESTSGSGSTTTSKESTSSGSGSTTSKESTSSGSGSTTTSKESTSSGSSTTSKESTSSSSTATSKESTSSGGTTSKESTSGGSSTTSRESTSSGGTTSKESTSSGSTTSKKSTGSSAISKESTGGGTTSGESTGGGSQESGEAGTEKEGQDTEANSGGATSKESTSGSGAASKENTGNGSRTEGENAGGSAASGKSTSGSSVSGKSSANSNHSTLLANADVVTESEGREEEALEEPVYARPSVTMDMEDVSILTDEMLQMAKEQNVDLILQMNDRAAWHVNVGSVQGNFADMDMAVSFDRGVIPQDLLAQYAGADEYLEFSLAHDGPFGFGAQLEILLDPADCGRYANLFYYDSEAGTLEFICAAVIDENGYAIFDMEHASDYVIIISDQPMTGISPETAESDEAGRGFPWGRLALAAVIAAVLAALAAGGYFLFKMRREDDDEEDDGDDDDEEEDDSEDGDEDDDDENDDEDDEDDEEEDADTGENGEENLEEIGVEAESHGRTTDAGPVSGQPEREPEQREQEDVSSEAAPQEESQNAEDDWIEDEDWNEPEQPQEKDPYAEDHAENDWIEDDEWDISNDWIDDDEWAKKENGGKTAI